MCDRNIGGRVRMLARPQGQGNKKRQLEHRSHQQKVVTLHPFSSPPQGRASKHACEAAFSTRPCASSGLSNTITFFLLFAVFLTGTNCSLREKSIATSWLMSFRSIHGG